MPAGTVTDSVPFTVTDRVIVYVVAPDVTVDVLEPVAPGDVSAGRRSMGGTYVVLPAGVPSAWKVRTLLNATSPAVKVKFLAWCVVTLLKATVRVRSVDVYVADRSLMVYEAEPLGVTR